MIVIYYRHFELCMLIVAEPKLPLEEATFFRKYWYSFFFQYWVLHRSKDAQFPPAPTFEVRCAHKLDRWVSKYLDLDDPLNILKFYKDGEYQNVAPIDTGDGIRTVDFPPMGFDGFPATNLSKLADYQKYVSEFKVFFQTAAHLPDK